MPYKHTGLNGTGISQSLNGFKNQGDIMRKVYDEPNKYLIEFDDEDIDSGVDIEFINKLTKSDEVFEVIDDYSVLVYR